MNKCVFLVFLFLFSVLIVSCRSITEEEAIRITQDLVNERFKFFVSQDEETPTVNKADITITNIERKDFWVSNKKYDAYHVYLKVKSNQTGEVKQANLVVIVDSKKGEVLKWGSMV